MRAATSTALPERSLNLLGWFAAGLMLVLPFAHTVALRYVLLALVLLGLAACLKPRRVAMPLVLPIMAWLAFTLASSVWSVAPFASLRAWLEEAFYPLMLFYAFYLAASRQAIEHRLKIAACISLALLAMISMAGYDAVAADKIRPGVLYYYPGVGQASSYAVLALPLFVLMTFNGDRRWSALGIIGLMSSAIVGVVSLNRMFWPAAAATLLCAMAFRPRTSRRPFVWIAALAIMSVLVVYIYHLRGLGPGDALGPGVIRDFLAMLNNDPRQGIWRSFSSRALEHPWLGLGFGKFVPHLYFQMHYASDPMLGGPGGWQHAHSLFLNSMLQVGLVGVVLQLCLLGSLVWCFARARVQAPAAAWAGIALVLAMVLKNVTDDFMRDSMALYFWALAGWLLALARRGEQGPAGATLRVGETRSAIAAPAGRVCGDPDSGCHGVAHMPSLSAVIISRNEADRIAACIASVQGLADDIVVLDSGSTDGTQALCRRLDARVIDTDWPGYGAQKNRAVAAALHDWVLCLDADERLTPELTASIRTALAAPSAAGYRFRRCNRFLGRDLRHGEGYPDWSLRLFDRRRGRWSEDAVHEAVVVDGPVAAIDGDLRHESAESLADYLAKQNRYTTLAAAQALDRGKRASLAHLVLSPLVRFVKFYVVRLGFLDGVPGLVHIAIGCCNSFMKYAKMREAQRDCAPARRERP